MIKKKVIAELIDPGKCRYYRRGQKFVIDGGFKPAGLCESGYSTVWQAIEAASSDKKLPGPDNNKIMVSCSCHGAVWEVHLGQIDQSKCAERLIEKFNIKPTENIDENLAQMLNK